MEVKLFEFNEQFANLPGGYVANVPRDATEFLPCESFESLMGKLSGADRDRLVEMYEARREYSAEELARITRPAIRWDEKTATPIRKQGETTEQWREAVKRAAGIEGDLRMAKVTEGSNRLEIGANTVPH